MTLSSVLWRTDPSKRRLGMDPETRVFILAALLLTAVWTSVKLQSARIAADLRHLGGYREIWEVCREPSWRWGIVFECDAIPLKGKVGVVVIPYLGGQLILPAASETDLVWKDGF